MSADQSTATKINTEYLLPNLVFDKCDRPCNHNGPTYNMSPNKLYILGKNRSFNYVTQVADFRVPLTR